MTGYWAMTAFATRIVSAFAGLAACLLYTSDAADERSSVDLGGRRIIKKKKKSRERSGPTNYKEHD